MIKIIIFNGVPRRWIACTRNLPRTRGFGV